MSRAFGLWLSVMAALVAAPAASAGDIVGARGDWAALASDIKAGQVGDSLTVLIYEEARASNSAESGSRKQTALHGEATAGRSEPNTARLGITGDYEGAARLGRADQMVAQISVTVTEALANGDLRVAGEQNLNLNGERTRIRVEGRVRRADISGANTVLSTRLADAKIAYTGSGFTARGGKPGLVNRWLSKLGVL